MQVFPVIAMQRFDLKKTSYTVVVRIIGTLGKYDQRRLWKLICIVNPFDLLFKKTQKI